MHTGLHWWRGCQGRLVASGNMSGWPGQHECMGSWDGGNVIGWVFKATHFSVKL